MFRGSLGAELCSPCANRPAQVGWILLQTAGWKRGGCFFLSQLFFFLIREISQRKGMILPKTSFWEMSAGLRA